MSRCMCGHHANGSRPAACCERRDMRDGDLALSGEACASGITSGREPHQWPATAATRNQRAGRYRQIKLPVVDLARRRTDAGLLGRARWCR